MEGRHHPNDEGALLAHRSRTARLYALLASLPPVYAGIPTDDMFCLSEEARRELAEREAAEIKTDPPTRKEMYRLLVGVPAVLCGGLLTAVAIARDCPSAIVLSAGLFIAGLAALCGGGRPHKPSL